MQWETTLHSFEVGRRGKPDELDSQIANIVIAEMLASHPNAKADIRIQGSRNHQHQHPMILIAGEISQQVLQDTQRKHHTTTCIIDHYRHITKQSITAEHITRQLNGQSDHLAKNSSELKAGDTGTCIAVAYANTPVYLPRERHLAVWLRDYIDTAYSTHDDSVIQWSKLHSDGKIEVLALYQWTTLLEIKHISFAIEHDQAYDLSVLSNNCKEIVKIYRDSFTPPVALPELSVNTAGPWTLWWWQVDTGTREAKPYRDGFSSYGHCEDSFSGEDPSKPGATWTLLARKIAVFLVQHGYASFAKVTLCYRIGMMQPYLHIATGSTSTLDQAALTQLVLSHFDLNIWAWIEQAQLYTSDHYHTLVQHSDYFQSADFYWNRY